MSLLAQLLVAWFGINILILALMWHNANERRRRLEAYERERESMPRDGAQSVAATHGAVAPATAASPAESLSASEAGTLATEPPRVVVMVNGDTPARRPRPASAVLQAVQAVQAVQTPSTASAPCHCDCHALRAEIRNLRLTVAELSIDRASLLAKLQPRPVPRAKPLQRSAAARS
jgi:hypothetical protein